MEQLWQHEWLYDPFYRFIDANKLNDERFQALLIDRNKEIILIGNPIQNIALKKLYEETIWKYIEKK